MTFKEEILALFAAERPVTAIKLVRERCLGSDLKSAMQAAEELRQTGATTKLEALIYPAKVARMKLNAEHMYSLLMEMWEHEEMPTEHWQKIAALKATVEEGLEL